MFQDRTAGPVVIFYEEVRVSFTENLDEDEKLLFLQKFSPLRNIAPHLYARRRKFITYVRR